MSTKPSRRCPDPDLASHLANLFASDSSAFFELAFRISMLASISSQLRTRFLAIRSARTCPHIQITNLRSVDVANLEV